ncbi:Gfo/Idh/MocA family protein [Parasphingopyxis lamellibrachiae]|uniref:D-galactose 1-dehydrogenase/L-arabinose 1-dehydrogenase n=1 Tax=Parasphingopyxis lamellibrachiae TaxID=680125 RepID=A0A3D9FEB5_9SPHN|nr:Gfo/Idh/MocA family oxidoreductase [Parasphingopyxis lamellibrachiae]RED16174.1 D-galactose 1-dehydrogenase/L-arabinose 1- dehydrogenase [Parasphingopyxis lamellibrachiae]
MRNQKINFQLALIGFGVSARANHLPAIADSGRFELTAIVDPVSTYANIDCFTSIAALQKSHLQIDAVALCTPPSDRVSLIGQCLEAGWHIMLEKPPVATANDLEKLRELPNPVDCSIFATWHSVENPAVDAAARWLERHPVHELRLRWLEHVNDWHPNQNWLWRENGFGVFDAGINAFSILDHILPGTLSISEAELFIPKNVATPATAELQFALNGRPIGLASLDLLHPGAPVWAISILSGGSELLLLDGGKRLDINGRTMPTEGTAEYERVYGKFANLIDRHQSSVETRPLELVLDALNRGKATTVAPIDIEQI